MKQSQKKSREQSPKVLGRIRGEIPEGFPRERISKCILIEKRKRNPRKINKRIPGVIREEILEGISEGIPKKISEEIQKIISDNINGGSQKGIYKRIPEGMTDENLNEIFKDIPGGLSE